MDKMSAVSSLKEFCAKSKTPVPKYDYIDGEDGGYVCKIIVMEIEANGNGRSRRDSQHAAAANMLKKLRTMPGLSKHMSDDAVENAFDNGSDLYDELGNLKRDMVKVKDAPEFLARCTVASKMRYGKSDRKGYARQRAAIWAKPSDVSAAPAEAINDREAERHPPFTTVRKQCDKHNYYKNFYPHLKKAAFDVINSESYANEKDQLMDLLSALKITPNISTAPSKTDQVVVKVELDVDFNKVFLETEDRIYGHMIGYFKDMLV
ncbi:uncharacterized protein DMAD_00719 [Drosophila madeirensis]|uniref:DRBM domain-containing protein n=1 Tax=Drosophila madeirensis TaxID=30013 RepID=A0AAU9FYE1_DROMD